MTMTKGYRTSFPFDVKLKGMNGIMDYVAEGIEDASPYDYFDFETNSIMLKNGEELITNMAEVDALHFCLSIPYKIVVMPHPEGQRVGMMPYLHSSTDLFMIIEKSSVAILSCPTEKFINNYTICIDEFFRMIVSEKEAQEEKLLLESNGNKEAFIQSPNHEYDEYSTNDYDGDEDYVDDDTLEDDEINNNKKTKKVSIH